MCLCYAKQVLENKPKIGYKAVIATGNHYLSIFQGFKYEVGKIYTSLVETYTSREGTFIGEAIHLFQDLETAREYSDYYNLKVIECQILDDAIVFSGRESEGYRRCYAVSKIKVLREI